MADARDKLAQIAKLSDARLKLQKLRASNVKKVNPTIISRKTGHTGRITLSTNKSTQNQRSLPSFIPPLSRSLSYKPPPISEPHYIDEMIMGYNNGKYIFL